MPEPAPAVETTRPPSPEATRPSSPETTRPPSPEVARPPVVEPLSPPALVPAPSTETTRPPSAATIRTPSPEATRVPAPETTRPPAVIEPLEPPALSQAPPAPGGDSPWHRLAREWHALDADERDGVARSLANVSRLGEWVVCFLPVLDNIDQDRGDLPGLDRLPPPARQEWQMCHRTLHGFADVDLVVCDRLRRELVTPSAAVPEVEDAEAQYLADAGLLDAERGTLPRRLRRHLLAPGSGRLQELVLALQYLIEAYPVEHLERAERKAYLGAVRRRLEDRGLSTKFHHLVAELASGLGLDYRQARFYKARAGESGAEFLTGRFGTIDLSARLGFAAGTEEGVVVRLSELFLLESTDGVRYSGQAWVDKGTP